MRDIDNKDNIGQCMSSFDYVEQHLQLLHYCTFSEDRSSNHGTEHFHWLLEEVSMLPKTRSINATIMHGGH